MLPLLRNAQLVHRHVGHVSREDILPRPIFAKELKGTSYATNIFGATIEALIRGEELMTKVKPQCGASKWGKCPIPGHTYFF